MYIPLVEDSQWERGNIMSANNNNLCPEGRLINHRLIRVVHAGSKTISQLAIDDKGMKFLVTYVNKEKVLKKLQYKAFLAGNDADDSYESIKAEADAQVSTIEQNIKDVALRIRGIGSENVALVYDVGCDQAHDRTVIVSEYVPGFDFFLGTRGFTPLQMISLFVQALNGLYFVHKCGYLHLNIKISRIRIDLEGEPPIVKLCDFGFAIPKTKYDGGFLGTSLYMAPEVAFGLKNDVDESSDLYSFGILMYYCLTQRFPTEHRLVNGHLKDEIIKRIECEGVFSPPKHINDEISDDLSNLVMDLLESKPKKRLYRSAQDVIREFEKRWPEESAKMPHEVTSTLYGE